MAIYWFHDSKKPLPDSSEEIGKDTPYKRKEFESREPKLKI
jgi:hypothetical protein